MLDEGRRIIRLYYLTFDDRLPRCYVDEHRQMIDAIQDGNVERADKLAQAHAQQIVQQIQDYVARDMSRSLELRIPSA